MILIIYKTIYTITQVTTPIFFAYAGLMKSNQGRKIHNPTANQQF